MFRWLNKKRGQNTAEYAILIGVIVAAAIAMQVYIRRGMQARVKEAVEFTKTSDDDAGGNLWKCSQYEPYYLSTNYETIQDSSQTEFKQRGGGVDRQTTRDTTTRIGNQTYANYMIGG